VLLKHNANIEVRDTMAGGTPLLWAAYGDSPNTFRYLLNKGADLKARSRDDMGIEEAILHRDSKKVENVLRELKLNSERLGPIRFAGVNTSGEYLLFDNREYHTIEDVEITVTGGFKAEIGYLSARDRMAIPPNAFTDPDGKKLVLEKNTTINIIKQTYREP
jgi:hypothetical protein